MYVRFSLWLRNRIGKTFMPAIRRQNAYIPLSVSSALPVIDLPRLILRSSPPGECSAAPGQNFALLALENQSLLVDCSRAFEPQFEEHAASTEVPALHNRPVDRHLASAHIVPNGGSYCQGLYQDSPAGYLSAPGLPLLSPVRFQTTHAIALPYLEE